jgi:holdfast attachment protein HfaA
MHRSTLYCTFAALIIVLGAKAAFGQTLATQGALSSSSAAMNGLSNSASYNSGAGAASGAENQAASGQVRDAQGNLVIVNGVMTGASSYSHQDGVQQTGAGTAGTIGNSASALAIGNSLNVNVIGNWNTVVVDSTQTNNGDQNANVSLNGDLKF